MAATVHLHLVQGQTFRHVFNYTRRPAPTEDPVALETVGCTARMQLRAKYGADVLLELTTENGGLIVDEAVQGRVTVFISAEQTDALGATADPLKARTSFAYDLELVYPGGDVLRVMQSAKNTIEPNITRTAVGP